MSGISGLKVVFVAGFGPLVKDPAASNAFYVDALGLPLEQQAGGGYYHGEKLDGVRHFALWPLSEAAQSCFGADSLAGERGRAAFLARVRRRRRGDRNRGAEGARVQAAR